MFEVRELCLKAVSLCLANKNSKLTAAAVEGFQRLLRDRMFWTLDTEDEERLLPLQITSCVAEYIVNQVESVQVDLLKVLLEMACTGTELMTQTSVEAVLAVCLKIVHGPASPSKSILMAAQATSSQTIECFVKHLVQTDSLNNDVGFEEELFPLLSSLCQKVNETWKVVNSLSKEASNGSTSISNTAPHLALLLKCIFSALVALNCDQKVITEKLLAFLWQTLCPLLIKLLGANDGKAKTSDMNQLANHEHGRGATGLTKAECAYELKLVFK